MSAFGFAEFTFGVLGQENLGLALGAAEGTTREQGGWIQRNKGGALRARNGGIGLHGDKVGFLRVCNPPPSHQPIIKCPPNPRGKTRIPGNKWV